MLEDLATNLEKYGLLVVKAVLAIREILRAFNLPRVKGSNETAEKINQCADSFETDEKNNECVDSFETASSMKEEMRARYRYERLVLLYRYDLAATINNISNRVDLSRIPDFKAVKDFFDNEDNDAIAQFVNVTRDHFDKFANAVISDSDLFSFICGANSSNSENLQKLIQSFDTLNYIWSVELPDGIPEDIVYPIMLEICQFLLSGISDADSTQSEQRGEIK